MSGAPITAVLPNPFAILPRSVITQGGGRATADLRASAAAIRGRNRYIK